MIVVTGANGFIGSDLVRSLNEIGREDIVCVDTVDLNERSEPLRKSRYEKFFNPKSFLDWLLSLPKNEAPEVIFHMGAISATTETDWEKLVINNVELPKTLFRYAHDKSVPFIYASSGAVYGGGEAGFNDASDTKIFSPLNLYGRSKRDFDIWALEQDQMPQRWVGLRFFNVYGPNEYHKGEMASVVYKAFLQIKASGRLRLFRSHNPNYRDGEQLRDFVYVKDITRWMIEIFQKKNFASGIYNLGFGRARTWLSLAEAVFREMGLPVNIEWIDIPAPIRNQYQYFTEAVMEKARAQNLSEPLYDLEAGVDDYVKNYLLASDPYL